MCVFHFGTPDRALATKGILMDYFSGDVPQYSDIVVLGPGVEPFLCLAISSSNASKACFQLTARSRSSSHDPVA